MKYPIDYTAKVRVAYYDTDQMGIVWHGNYIKYFEDAREEMFREMRLPYDAVEKAGIMMPIVEVDLKYKHPAKYDDILSVKVHVEEPPRARIKIDYEIVNQNGELCVTGSTTLGFINSQTRIPCRAPEALR